MIIPQPRDPNEHRPEPAQGCVACAYLARLRERAHAAGDGSGVSDANVRMRRHQAQEHPT
ncbi:hypothetical protein SAMN05421773_11929 [Streptomyces aidingensis]|uniref:Uncharacterized protein n=1 Tax=Streptomyces aidingensis TaxID=910347 RepID=A0A1I1TBM2_9ACTN|nr:hypothetical protein SAMN05421773_11929 [Streptomyces aidingensis]